ncbi:DUF2303 family protein, partial [Salmonella enterica]|uniref:DUF2303 family protein n=1 Tax=Salmonella enterica TaxID=28901 RepID=UPI00398C65F8
TTRMSAWLSTCTAISPAFASDGNTMQISQAAPAVRRITVQPATQQDHADGDFSGKKSLMQSIEASSKDVIPVAFEFKCVPYEGLGERAFSLRQSLLTGAETRFILRILPLQPPQQATPQLYPDWLNKKSHG